MNYLQDIIDYYQEEMDIDADLSKMSVKEKIDLVNDLVDFNREFKDLHEWIADNGETADTGLFYSEFNYGTDEDLNSVQLKLLKKYNFHVFSKAHLAVNELK